MKKPPRKPDPPRPEGGSPALPRAGISHRRPPIAADRAIERHLRSVSRRPGVAGILSRLPDAVVSFDREWRYVYMNRQAELNHERPASDFLGHNVWELFPEGRELDSYVRYQKAMESQQESVFEEYVPMLGRWFEQRLFPTKDGLTVIARDISDWREVKLERTKLAAALARVQTSGGVAEAAPAAGGAGGGSEISHRPGANSLRTFSTFFPRPGRREALVAKLGDANAFTAAVRDAGALAVEVQLADDPRGPVVITALWNSSADYQRWEAHPARAAILATLEADVDEICVEKYEVFRSASRD